MQTTRLKRTSPSLHLLMIVLIFGLALIGYVAIIWSGGIHGYGASKTVAARDLAFFVPIIAIFFWLTRKQKFKGEMMLLSTAVFLFAVGQLMQYRLFSDPEYGARGGQRSEVRQAKAQSVRMLNIKTGYDDLKKQAMFGNAENIPEPKTENLPVYEYSFGSVITSSNTFIPLMALAALIAGFKLFKDDRLLLWLQKHAFLIGVATLIPFAILAFLSEEGKFLGQTTPWEGVKIFFLVSFAGMLADTYHHLRRTRWGLPPARYLLPFIIVAAMPVIPFFALSDFGQMLVFFGVYVMLYVVAVRKKAQLAYALLIVGLVFVAFSGTSLVAGLVSADKKPATSFGVPGRVHFRFYQWLHTWEPPPPDTWWWSRDYKRYLQAKELPEPTDPVDIKRRNLDAWSDKVLQQSQGLFGVNEGGLVGEGLGLGFPETVPISDSDFIYAALAEETGLLGSLSVLIMIAAFVFAGTTISIGARDMFTKLLAAGFTAFVGFQAIVNIGGVLRLLPMTGITLPFVSHGGWSLITSFAMLGVLLAFSHRNALSRPVVEKHQEFVPVR